MRRCPARDPAVYLTALMDFAQMAALGLMTPFERHIWAAIECRSHPGCGHD